MIYTYWQPIYDLLKEILRQRIEFRQGFTDSIFDQYFHPHSLILLDDCDEEFYNSAAANQFVKGGVHHNNVNLVLISQSIFSNTGKYARSILKNIKIVILARLGREKHSLVTFAIQSNFKKSFLLNAYSNACESLHQPPGLPHLFLNYCPQTFPLLTVQSNVIQPPSPAPGTLIDRLIRVYPTESGLEMLSNQMGLESETRASGGAKVFYLLNQKQIDMIREDSPPKKHKRRVDTDGVAVTVTEKRKKSVALADDDVSSYSKSTEKVISSMLSVPSFIRSRMIQLCKLFERTDIRLNDRDQTLIFPNPDDKGGLVYGSTQIIDVLMFFASPKESRAPRPAELFSLCLYLVSAGLGYHATFDDTKQPALLLKRMKKDIIIG